MRVLKFGGSSLATAQKIEGVYNIINHTDSKKIVVLSAIGKTTDLLIGLIEAFSVKAKGQYNINFKKLLSNHLDLIEDLFQTDEFKSKARTALFYHLDYINLISQSKKSYKQTYNEILIQGEMISTAIFFWYSRERNANSTFLKAENFMRIDINKDPDLTYIEKHLNCLLAENKETELFITQGFLCKNHLGYIDNLERGGSDYTATIIGNVIKANEIQIWSDIDGVHNNDPRYIPNTKSIPYLSYDEANELAYFGAKVLHPTCILPAQSKGIPVVLKNTFSPKSLGTVISNKTVDSNIKAIAGKDGITCIKIKSGRMLNAYGFLKRIFEIFEKHQTSVDMVTTSEVAVSITIDDTSKLNEIESELNDFSHVEIDHNQSIICIVGNFIAEKSGMISKVTQSIENIPIRMISFGGSKHNISILVNNNDKINALKKLHRIFNQEKPIKIREEIAYAN